MHKYKVLLYFVSFTFCNNFYDNVIQKKIYKKTIGKFIKKKLEQKVLKINFLVVQAIFIEMF